MKRAVSLALAVALLPVAGASAAPDAAQVAVFFLKGEQLTRVMRPGASPADAVRRLLAGPTRAELRRGVRTYLPVGTPVRSVTVARGLTIVDLGRRFAVGRDSRTLLARLSQLVRTATWPRATAKVQLLIDGARVSGVFPGVATEAPITFHYLQTPNVPIPNPPQPKLPAPDDHIRSVQQRLIRLSYLGAGSADGRLGPITQSAILAFQKWERLSRTGLLDAQTESRLKTASRPSPVTHRAAGKRAEILLDRQIALLIVDNRVLRTIAVSTGKPSTPTPPGNYRVYAKIRRWWSTPFREWLPWAVPFVGGIAFHEFADVPVYPASHGCVRQSVAVARGTYDFADVGMPVEVMAKS
jgi:peptidoglycan hydrolase-like protein with peptidoglycan-binding domain